MSTFEALGGCTCREVRYATSAKPIFVNCCHCRWCQRETGSAFVINAMIESDRLRLTPESGAPKIVDTPSLSGIGQRIARCPTCRIALWSNYGRRGDVIRFVRVGTFDEPDRFPPNAHIFTQSKQPWLTLPAGTPAFDEYYDRDTLWPAERLERWHALFPK